MNRRKFTWTKRQSIMILVIYNYVYTNIIKGIFFSFVINSSFCGKTYHPKIIELRLEHRTPLAHEKKNTTAKRLPEKSKQTKKLANSEHPLLSEVDSKWVHKPKTMSHSVQIKKLTKQMNNKISVSNRLRIAVQSKATLSRSKKLYCGRILFIEKGRWYRL